MTVYVKHDGLWALDAESEQAALRAGCVGLKFGEKLGDVAGNVLLAHSTVGWIGVYRIQPDGKWPLRIKRFRSFDRALRCAQREDRA